jgi:hypothetical protein
VTGDRCPVGSGSGPPPGSLAWLPPVTAWRPPPGPPPAPPTRSLRPHRRAFRGHVPVVHDDVPPCVELPPMHRAIVERRLSDAHDRLVRARTELAVLDEQLVVVNEIADDTRLRALVAETPVASKEHDEASRHATAMLQTRNALVDRIAELERRQDELLDRLVVGPG